MNKTLAEEASGLTPSTILDNFKAEFYLEHANDDPSSFTEAQLRAYHSIVAAFNIEKRKHSTPNVQRTTTLCECGEYARFKQGGAPVSADGSIMYFQLAPTTDTKYLCLKCYEKYRRVR